MSTDKTQHYQLNQWEEDKVLRLDFNADNQIIDGALAALAELSGRQAGNRYGARAWLRLHKFPPF